MNKEKSNIHKKGSKKTRAELEIRNIILKRLIKQVINSKTETCCKYGSIGQCEAVLKSIWTVALPWDLKQLSLYQIALSLEFSRYPSGVLVYPSLY
jgi:hypothetical protein